MKKVLSATLATICLCALLLSGCGGPEIVALYFAAQGSAGGFDPQIASDATARIVVRNCFEGLVAPGEDGGILPAAAERWTVSEDGLTYRFYLREGDLWHLTSNAAEALEGKLPEDFAPKVTAADFEFGIRRAADPATGAPNADLLADIQNYAAVAAGEMPPSALGVRALSPTLLEITLETPQPEFLSLLTEPVFMPCNETFFVATGGRYGLLIKYLLSNGPFYLSQFDDASYRIRKNPDYAGPNAAAADVVWFYTQSSEAAYFESLRSEDLAGGYLTAAQLSRFSPGRRCSVISLNDVLTGILVNAGGELLSNGDLRRAVFAAMDAQNPCAQFGCEYADAWYPRAVRCGAMRISPDGEEAQAALGKALEALGRESVSLSLLCEDRYETGLRRQLQDWQKILGAACNIRIEAVSADALRSRVESGDYELALYPVTASSERASDWFSVFGGSGALTRYEDEAFSAAVSESRFLEADAAPTRLGALMREAAVFLPLWADSRVFLCTRDVTGVQAFPGADRLYVWRAVK